MLRLIVGVLSLLVVAAVVMMLARQQLHAVGQLKAPPAATANTSPAAPAPTVAEGVRQIQRQVADDVGRALQQGASRAADAE